MSAAALSPALERHAALDRRLVAAVRRIRVLPTVAWPAAVERAFLERAQRGDMALPQVDYARPDLARERAELEAIAAAADPGHPAGVYLIRTATSWRIAAEMLEAVGTAAVTSHAIVLYGRPGDAIPGGDASNLDAARHFVALADELGAQLALDEAAYCIPAEALRDELQATLDAFFGHGRIAVEADPELTAKAAAGATRIRLRSATCFSAYDRHQLLAHEAFVHSLTALNGREQPYLASLSRTSPRVTATQEGLAVFAELMSGSIDIGRLKRISLRILAIDMALDGADFVEVFRYFRDAGQTAVDSFNSAQRVFRGVPPTGGAAFTKDNVYLHGLLTVHTFFRWALKNNRLDLMRQLFAGKMTLHDAITLAPLFESGFIAPPQYLPPWVSEAAGLAGKLAFSLFANRIHMTAVDATDLTPGL
ncbi:MAG: flavohemoglobin expression-modulating QEGLA motif protein [Mizugakiibacter sp.]|uniref:flavohemoglobin expression-modulating QEGLA motif protein n=1 Tax=Mizugakiibacter sp. TaxID=1972610 RepID=UPI0031C3650D|nr:flavohemoglobin expression-modulating QEGLA motif protein [Xanthomonadaceae bacterium]